jgi:DNA-directed RNA polymerase specialized sigma24 family protein
MRDYKSRDPDDNYQVSLGAVASPETGNPRRRARVSARKDTPAVMDTLSDRKAEFAEALRQHQNQLFGYIYSLVRDLDDADDLFQQTSLVLWDKFALFDASRSFIAWACGVARFEVSNFLRSRSRHRVYFSDELGMMLIDAHEELEPSSSRSAGVPWPSA